MTNLKEVRGTKKIKLPKTGAEIEVWDDLLAGDIEAIQKAKDDVERVFIALTKIIKDWDLVDENGQKLAVNAENLKKIPLQDLMKLVEEAFGEEFWQKKTLTPSL